MRFWDTSALVPMLINEPTAAACQRLLVEDQRILAWWGTYVECVSAIARRQRDGTLAADQARHATLLLEMLSAEWSLVEPSDEIVVIAARLVRRYPLSAADALQLAAAWRGSGEDPQPLAFVCLDQRLRDAADHEGFTLLPR